MGLVIGTSVTVFGDSPLIINWTSDSSGNVQYNFNDVWNHNITRIDFKPDCVYNYGPTGPTGPAAPTNYYDVQLLDIYGYDLLQGLASDRSSTTAEQIILYQDGILPARVKVSGYIQLRITNAGNAKNGTIIFHREPA